MLTHLLPIIGIRRIRTIQPEWPRSCQRFTCSDREAQNQIANNRMEIVLIPIVTARPALALKPDSANTPATTLDNTAAGTPVNSIMA